MHSDLFYINEGSEDDEILDADDLANDLEFPPFEDSKSLPNATAFDDPEECPLDSDLDSLTDVNAKDIDELITVFGYTNNITMVEDQRIYDVKAIVLGEVPPQADHNLKKFMIFSDKLYHMGLETEAKRLADGANSLFNGAEKFAETIYEYASPAFTAFMQGR